MNWAADTFDDKVRNLFVDKIRCFPNICVRILEYHENK